nr:5'/3'-nucleotidase SurE [Opitutaceae bacterium]
MKLLVTNDDGIGSLFLHELIFALQAAGHETYVVAPVVEQSWTGASKTRNRPVKSGAVNRGFGCPTWMVDGTPSDCVNIALAHLLGTKVDGVVSGINVGFNCSLGFILASGTVAGAWEGALHGLPAMAVSQDVSEAVYDHLKERGGTPAGELLATLKSSAAHAARLVPGLFAATPANS